jgi:hypothetical protein
MAICARQSPTGVLDRSLGSLRSLVDRSLAEVRLSAGIPARPELLSLAAFIAEVKIAGALEAQARGCGFSVPSVCPDAAASSPSTCRAIHSPCPWFQRGGG